jgi:hypothetical protein
MDEDEAVAEICRLAKEHDCARWAIHQLAHEHDLAVTAVDVGDVVGVALYRVWGELPDGGWPAVVPTPAQIEKVTKSWEWRHVGDQWGDAWGYMWWDDILDKDDLTEEQLALLTPQSSPQT